jgi:hypothetical protein
MPATITTYTLQTSADSHGTGGYTTGSLTIPASSLVVCSIQAMSNGGSTDFSASLTISDSVGLTWTPRITVGNATAWSIGQRVWTAPFTAGGSITITADCGANDIYQYRVHVVSFTGANTSSIGATASSGSFGTSGSQSLTLSAGPNSSSYVLGFLQGDDSGSTGASEGVGWTQLYENYTLFGTYNSQYITGHTSTTVNWQNIAVGGSLVKSIAYALEILEIVPTSAAITSQSASGHPKNLFRLRDQGLQ